MKKFIAYKKPILVCIGFLFFTLAANAQDAAAITAMLKQKEYARAKEAVDKLTSENETAENYFLKAIVYDSISNNVEVSRLLAEPRLLAFNALKKSAAINNEYVFNKGRELAADLQLGFINEGLANFNIAAERNSKPGFENALVLFKKAAQVNEFIYQIKWDSISLQPLLLSLLSKSAIYAEKEEDALIYSKKIIDKNSANKPLVTGQEIIYQWLLYYYSNRKEADTFNKYLVLAKAAYPASQYFVLVEMDWLRQQGDYTALFEKYRELMTAEPLNLQYKLAYSSDVFNSLWPVKVAGANITAAELIAILKPLTGAKQTATKAKLLLAKTYTNMARDVLAELKRTNNQALKKQHSNYLVLANKYLQQIITAKENVNRPEWKEAKQLLAISSRFMKKSKGR